MSRSTPSSSSSAPFTLPGSSSFAAVLSAVISPPAFPSLPTSLLSGRRSSRRFAVPQLPAVDGDVSGAAVHQPSPLSPRAPSIPSSSSPAAFSSAALAVKGSSAVLSSGPAVPFRLAFTRREEEWGGKRDSYEWKEQRSAEEPQVEAVRPAMSGRRAARHKTWQVGQSSPLAPPLAVAAVGEGKDSRESSAGLLPPVRPAPVSSPSSPFVLTFPSSSPQSTITVELSPLSLSSPPLRPSLSPAPPFAVSHSLSAAPVAADSSAPSDAPPSPASSSSSLIGSVQSRPPPLQTAGRRRSSLPLPLSASTASAAAAAATPPLSSSVWTTASKAASPTSSTPVSVHLRLRGLGDSAWSRSTVDRFGQQAKRSSLPDDRNAWGLDDPALTKPASPRLPPPSPSTGDAKAQQPPPSVALPSERRRSRRASQVEAAPQPVLRRERPQSMRTTRERRRAAELLRTAEAEMRPWGHWSQPGVRDGEEAKHPFPHRTHLFNDCQLRREQCDDRRCARHGPGRRDESSEDEDEGVGVVGGARYGGEGEEEKEQTTEFVAEAEVHNMTRVRLRGAGDAALSAAFSKATPAYAALSKLSPTPTSSISAQIDPFAIVDEAEGAIDDEEGDRDGGVSSRGVEQQRVA